ncbi:MAG: RDD family protein [Acidimicrobiia bacterium]|nr:RDD family protein [Acidimicrobiia bacterium]
MRRATPRESAGAIDPHLLPAPTDARRLAARVLDVLTVATWMWAMSIARILFHLAEWSDDVDVGPWGTSFLLAATFVVLYSAYEVTFVARTGATPGKDLMHIKVIADRDGSPPTLAQAVVRALPLVGAWLVPVWWGGAAVTAAVGGSGVADGERRRGIHDLLAGTRVVYSPEVHPPDLDVAEAAAERRSHFIPKFVDPIQIIPHQMFRHPGMPRPGGPGLGDEEDDRGR